ncbi:ROK family protein [Chitinophaga arvensicola]|uniref:Glucokinase n=1 Tax=Chitinophaga arvensicola TaxID=29529 RepID=A0A1I0S7P3_9BACT|nr:ROK family protein [Chitinophaga arvensicola]SEW51841.1 glucokinase [Chitinophaga arvensicola]
MLLGFDIGGTKCAVVIGRLDEDGKPVIEEKQVLPTDKPAYEMIAQLFSVAEVMLFKYNATAPLEGIGISCGGPLSSKNGTILSPPNLPGWDNIPIVELTEKRFGIRTILQNDANACAVAEWKYGAGKGVNNMIFLTFGTGMGAGLILDGRLYTGISDLAGEVGHLRLSATGPVGFGKAGSFEGYCSGGGIAQLGQIKAREKLQMGIPVTFCTSLEQLGNITAKSVAEAAFQQDETALEVYHICAQHLGKGLALLIDVLNPELIVLGSIYGRAQSLLEPVMQEVIRKEALQSSARVCRIVPAGLGEGIGDMAALSLALLSAEG